MKTCIAIFFLSVLTLSAQDKWVKLGESRNYNAPAIASYRIAKEATATSYGKIWIKFVVDTSEYSYLQAIDKVVNNIWEDGADYKPYYNYESSMLLFEVDCKEERVRLVRIVDHDQSGNVIRDDEEYRSWHDMTPDTMDEIVVAVACNKLKNNNKN